MDMKKVVETLKTYDNSNFSAVSFLNNLAVESALSGSECEQLYKMAGIPDDCARYCASFYPEYVCYAIDELFYYMSNQWCCVYTEEQFAQELDRLGCANEDDFAEDYYCTVIRDKPFEGVCVFGG